VTVTTAIMFVVGMGIFGYAAGRWSGYTEGGDGWLLVAVAGGLLAAFSMAFLEKP
jgi:hypothetical protein